MRAQRIQRAQISWEAVLDRLADALQAYRYLNAIQRKATQSGDPLPPHSASQTRDPLSAHSASQTRDPLSAHSASQTRDPTAITFNIPVIDLYTCRESATISVSDHKDSTLCVIMHAGYLAMTPVDPQLAISINTLELYQCFRLCQPSFSNQAFAKVICDIYSLPYRRCYHDAISETFKVYVWLDNIIQRRIKSFC